MEKKTYQTKTIRVSNLTLNTENPRFLMVSNQIEAISIIIEKQNGKLEKLGQDIVLNGINPSDIISVVPSPTEKEKYIVLEGNRRITVLKLLNNPNLINEEHKSVLNQFKKLSESFRRNPIDSILCIVYETKDDAYKWIKLKHTGENEGVGTVTWNAQQKARFEERNGGKASYALQIIDFLSKDNNFDSNLKRQLPDVPSSSLQRLIGDPDIRKILGIDLRDGKITTQLPPEEIRKPLTKIIKNLIHKNFKVKEIYSKSDRLNYIGTFKSDELPNTGKTIGEWGITTSTPPKLKEIKSQIRNKPLSTNRNTIIPNNCAIRINKTRINKIYYELRKLDLKCFENAAAVLFRVFIELSIDTYMEQCGMSVNQSATLVQNINTVSKDLIKREIITKQESKPIRVAVSSLDSILSINTFNAYVHNKHFNPEPKNLKTAWDSFETFLIKLWTTIK